MRLTIRAPVVLAVILSLTCLATHSETGRRTAPFDTDPGWEGFQNRLPDNFPPRVLQDFGYRTSNLAGKAPGEMGGYIQSSVHPASYSKPVGPFTFKDHLSFSGSFTLLEGRSIMGYTTLSEAFVGFFNPAGQGWRPKNFLGFRLMGTNEPDGVYIELSFGTSRGSAGGGMAQKGGGLQNKVTKELDTSLLVRIPPDASRHGWTLEYAPNPNGEEGEIRFTIDGFLSTRKIPKDQFGYGATFNRFGIFNNLQPGRALVAYFDDLTINGESEDFTVDPGWEGVGNDEYFEDPVQYGTNDFGYSPTNYAGAQPGEIGGRLWRVHRSEENLKGWFGDDVGQLTFNDRLEARGKIAIRKFCIDTGMHIGFFNSEKQGWPPTSFVGVNLDSFTPIGRAFMPMYGAVQSSDLKRAQESPWFIDGDKVLDFSITYDPAAAGGRGAVTATLGSESSTLELQPGAKEEGAVMNRFGIFNMQDNNGKFCEVYLDDLEYTVGR